ncbi:hypothetical protein Bca101_010857 [Brassica carinata]
MGVTPTKKSILLLPSFPTGSTSFRSLLSLGNFFATIIERAMTTVEESEGSTMFSSILLMDSLLIPYYVEEY